MPHSIKWLDEPEQHDYTAALSVLTLDFSLEHASELIHALRAAPVEEWKAKDIMRLSHETILARDNSHIQHNFKKIREGKELSPILLVRTPKGLLIADGYHRACTIYLYDEDLPVMAKIAGEES